MHKIKYFCQGQGKNEWAQILKKIDEKHEIPHEIVDLSKNGEYYEEKEKRIYEEEFKPRAKLLKKRTGKKITQLRSNKARLYHISNPGTIAIVNEKNLIEWYTIDNIEKILTKILESGDLEWDENG